MGSAPWNCTGVGGQGRGARYFLASPANRFLLADAPFLPNKETMKPLATLIGLGLVASLSAQSPLTTTFVANNAAGAGALTFVNLTVTVPAITVNRLDVNCNSAVGTQGRIRVWQTITGVPQFSGSEQNFANWQVLAEGSVISAGLGVASTCCFSVPFTLTSAMGTRGYAFEHIGIAPAYTNGTGTNQNYSNAELTLAAGVAASNGSYADQVILGGNVSIPFAVALLGGGNPRVFNGAIHYAVGSSAPVCSFSDRVGNGCGGGYASWFNISPTPAQASAKFQGKTVVMSLNADGAYDVNVLPAGPLVPFAGHAPLAGFTTSIAGNVATDDGEVVTPGLLGNLIHPTGLVTAGSGLVVHTNGMISTGSNLAALDALGGDDWAPTTTIGFSFPNTTWYTWHDLDITTAGAIRFNDDGTQVVITYDAVPSAFGVVTATSTVQYVFDYVGNVSITFQTIDPIANGGSNAYSGNPWLVGYSPAGVNTRPEYPLDSAVLSSQHGIALDTPHVALTSNPRPTFGSSINYDVNNLNAGFPLGFLYFSVANPFAPGLPLAVLGIGKPGCLLNFDLANGIGPFNIVAPGTVLTLNTATITPSMLGLDFWGQALVTDLLAADIFAAMTTSNALHQRIENT